MKRMLAYAAVRVLLISPASPWPARRGYQMRTAHLAEALAPRHAVTVVAQHDPSATWATPPSGIACRRVDHGRFARWTGLTGVRSRPVQVALHRQAALRAAVAATVATERPDVAVLVLSRLGDVVPALGDVPLVIDYVDALALNMMRRAARQPWLAPLWRWEARRMAAWDRRLLTHARAATVVAARDRDALLDGLDDEARDRLAPIHVVPLGLSVPTTARPEPAGPPTLVLTGNLGYFPTVDGALWFAREVWPRIRAARPDACWRLAGARPAPALRRLAGRDGIELVVEPPDLGAIRRRAHVALAPLRAGSGTPIKILEAMADGVPVVTTPGGQAGLDAAPDEALTVADDADAMVAGIVALLDDRQRADAQADAARRWLIDRHGQAAVGRRFEDLLASVVTR